MSAKLLTGREVAASLNEKTKEKIAAAKDRGIVPTVAFLRVGDKEDSLAYQYSGIRQCERLGIAHKEIYIPETATQDELIAAIEDINNDKSIHGVLMLRPLPAGFDEKAACAALLPEKDIDGITIGSLAGTFAGEEIDLGYPPCTAQAVIEIMDYYGINPDWKHAVVIGRSLVVGRPLAMMLMHKNATVTICHKHTKNLREICRQADLLIVTVGKMNVVENSFFSAGQVVIDVGIHVLDNGELRGDVDWKEAQEHVAAITPVPGGVGTVTTAVLMSHIADAAEKSML